MTYLPTILMNLINQASNYITGDTRFDLVYTINMGVNLSCLLRLSVFSSTYLMYRTLEITYLGQSVCP